MSEDVTNSEQLLSLKAKRFLMWLFLVSSFIYFAGLTSGYIVYTAGSPNRGIKTLLPVEFRYSTIVIIISSITMYMAYLAGKREAFTRQKVYLIVTIVLGALFFYLQLKAFGKLVDLGVHFSGNANASQSFIYVFTGSHLAHIVAGLFLLFGVWLGKMKNISQERNMHRLRVASIFWHFIDILWIYLYVFLLLNQ